MASDKDLAKLTVQLELQAAAFEAGAKEMDRTLKRMEKNTTRSSRGFDTLNKTLKRVGISFGALAGALSVGALTNAAKEAIAFGDAIGKTADKVGVSVEELQELRFAAKQSGVDVRQLDMGIQRFARRMGEAAQGTGELLKTTQALGIEFKNADGTNKSTVELLEQYAEAVGRAETQQEKLRLAFKAFDSEGAALVNLIGDGGEAMAKLRQEAVDLGLVLSEDLVRQSEVINDKFNILATQIKTGITEGFIEATSAALAFFDVFSEKGEAERRLAEIDANIEQLRAKLAEGRQRGSATTAQQLQNEIALRKEVQAQLDALIEREQKRNGTNVAANEQAAAQALQNEVDKLVASVNPLNELAKKLGVVDAALKQVSDPATIAALEDLREKLEFGEVLADDTDPVTAYQKKVEAYIGTLNSYANDTAAQLGIMYAALEQLTDPALIAEVEAAIERLELGVDIPPPDPDPYKDALKEIKDAVDGFSADFTNTLIDSLETGEARFDEFAKNILKTIAKIILNKIFEQFFTAITNPIFSSIGLQSVDLGEEGLTASLAQSNQALTREGEASTQMMTVGRAQPQLKSVSQSPVTVNVNNYGNDDVQVAERRDSNGGIEIDVLIKSTVRQGFANGDFDKVMQNTYGARRLGY